MRDSAVSLAVALRNLVVDSVGAAACRRVVAVLAIHICFRALDRSACAFASQVGLAHCTVCVSPGFLVAHCRFVFANRCRERRWKEGISSVAKVQTEDLKRVEKA